jgi:hypothetical protein
LDDLAWNGDELSGDPFLNINNGWWKLALADSDVTKIDFALTSGGGPADSTWSASKALGLVLKNLPLDYLGRSDLTFFVSPVLARAFAIEAATRDAPGNFAGIPVVADTHIAGSTNGHRIMLTPSQNLHHGVQRAITVDSQWQPRKRVLEYTVTVRDDFGYASGKPIVIAANLPTHLRQS